MIGPDGVEARKECLEPREIRTFRVHECLGAGDGRIVASIRPIPMREVGWAKPIDEVHMAIPPGTAAALADALVGKPIVLVPGGGSGGVQRLDVNKLIERMLMETGATADAPAP